MNANTPHRPMGPFMAMLRGLVRWLRVARLRALAHGELHLGHNVTFGPRARLLMPDRIEIGDNVSIGADLHVEANLRVGSDVLISSRVAVIGNDHRFDDTDQTVYWAGRLPAAEVVVEGDNLIGFGTILVGPVRVGRGCIVGAGSVVTRDLPPDTICLGAPARPIRQRRRAQRPLLTNEESKWAR